MGHGKRKAGALSLKAVGGGVTGAIRASKKQKRKITNNINHHRTGTFWIWLLVPFGEAEDLDGLSAATGAAAPPLALTHGLAAGTLHERAEHDAETAPVEATAARQSPLYRSKNARTSALSAVAVGLSRIIQCPQNTQSPRPSGPSSPAYNGRFFFSLSLFYLLAPSHLSFTSALYASRAREPGEAAQGTSDTPRHPPPPLTP